MDEQQERDVACDVERDVACDVERDVASQATINMMMRVANSIIMMTAIIK